MSSPSVGTEIILPSPEEAARLLVVSKCSQTFERVNSLLKPLTSPEEHTMLADALKTSAIVRRELADLWKPYKQQLFDAHKAASSAYNAAHDPLDTFEREAARLIISYEDRMERERKAEEERIQALVNTQTKQQTSAEVVEQVLQQAIDADAAGNHELAEQILTQPIIETPVMPPTVSIQSSVQKPSGLSRRSTWKGRLKGNTAVEKQANFEALVQAVARDLAKPADDRRGLIELLSLNDSALNNKAKTAGSLLNIPGCEPWEDVGLSKRTK